MGFRSFGILFLMISLMSSTASFARENAAGPSGRDLTLEEAIETSIRQNPELKAMAEDAEAEKTKASRTRYWADPEIGVRFYQVPLTENLSNTQDIDYIVRQKFPLGGKDKAAKEIAYHEYQHRLHARSLRGRELLQELKNTYYRLFATQRMLGVSRELEGNLRAVVASAQARIATNQASLTDATLGQTEIVKLQTERQSLLQKERELQFKLAQLMADEGAGDYRIVSKLDVPTWDTDLPKLLELSAMSHPALLSEKHHVEEKEWGVKAAKKEYIPDINFQAEYVQRPGSTGDAFTGEMMLNVPLILKKKDLGVKQAEAELASAHYMQQNAKNEVVYKIKEAFNRWESSHRILQLNRGSLLPQARQAFAATAGAFSTGKTGMAEVLSAAQLLLNAQLQYWQAFQDQAEAVFSLENAVGLTREEIQAGADPQHLGEIDDKKASVL